MNRRALILLLLCLPAIAGQSMPAQKPRLVIIYRHSCPPCQVLLSVWAKSPELRRTMLSAFDVRELDWDKPADRAKAIEYGVDVVPTFIAMRGTRRIAKSEGFATTMRIEDIRAATEKLMEDLGVEWPRVIAPPDHSPPPRVDSPAAETPDNEIDIPPARHADPPADVPTIDETARAGLDKLASQTRELKQSQESAAEVLRQQLADAQASTQAELRAIAKQLRESIVQQCPVNPPVRESKPAIPEYEPPIPESIPKPATSMAPDISTEMPSGPNASKWLQVGKWVAGTAVAVAAPEYAIPLSVGLSVAGWLLTRVRNRKGAGHRPGTFPVAPKPTAVETSATRGHGTPLPREYTEAVELLRLAEREGRIPIHEAIRGTLADDEIDRLTESIDPTTRQMGVELRDRIARRFNTVAPISQDPNKYQE